MSDQSSRSEYLETPATFWVVKFYDLGIVAPAALTIGIGLLSPTGWVGVGCRP